MPVTSARYGGRSTVARFLSGSVGVIRSMSDPLLMLTSFYEKLCTFDIGLLTGFYRVLAVGLDCGSTDPLRKNRLVAAGWYAGLKLAGRAFYGAGAFRGSPVAPETRSTAGGPAINGNRPCSEG